MGQLLRTKVIQSAYHTFSNILTIDSTAEITDLNNIKGMHNVLEFEISMNDLVIM